MAGILAKSSLEKLILLNQLQGSRLSCDVVKSTQLKINVIIHEEAFASSFFSRMK